MKVNEVVIKEISNLTWLFDFIVRYLIRVRIQNSI